MAAANVPVFRSFPDCSLCLKRLADVVSIPCGHTYCRSCTEGFLSEYENTGKYSCTECGQSFYRRPFYQDRPVDDIVDGLLKTALQADHSTASHPGPEDVDCDICTGPEHKAIKSCLECLASYCDEHLRLHNDLNPRTPHALVDATGQLQGMTCRLHDKLLEVYCRTDQRCICCRCMLDDHKGHDMVSASTGRAEKEEFRKSKEMIVEKEKQLKELNAAKQSLRDLALATEEESERLFAKLVQRIQSSHAEMKAQIRAQEEAELERVEGLLTQLEQEIAELKRSDAELEQLLCSQNHIRFLQSVQSLYLLPGSADAPNMAVNPQFSFGELVKSISVLKAQIEDIWLQEMTKISTAVKKDKFVVPSEPKTREEFLQYLVPLTLDPNSAHRNLRLSEENQAVACDLEPQPYPNHPERFDWWAQVLSREALSGRCYWEAQWTGLYGADVAVSYGDISRKGQGDDCGFGYNKHCWSLDCSISRYAFVHNNEETEIAVPTSHRIGVYLDHRAGLLSFYSVSDSMTLLHRVDTRFTQPVYAGFGLYQGSTARMCQPGKEAQRQTDVQRTRRSASVKTVEKTRRMWNLKSKRKVSATSDS
ncbi:tripartite motif-containing protein 16 isoform X2 [Salminus brasiliensis]|uniref:tripartite motif-containing protein 16 isoform X2 n=1 Tax=Salminus brasiliensis TaxID=930266 RepID=UPI003B8316FB